MRSRIFRCLGYVVAALAAVALMGVPALKSIDDRADQSSTAARAEAAQPAAATVDPPRPAALVPLYLTFAGLQALDIHSTMLALQGGGREANPVAGIVVGSPATFLAVKVAATAGIALAAERMRKHHPKAAVFLMIGLDSGYAVIAARNYAIMAQAPRVH